MLLITVNRTLKIIKTLYMKNVFSNKLLVLDTVIRTSTRFSTYSKNKFFICLSYEKLRHILLISFELHYSVKSSHPTYLFSLDLNYSFQVILIFVSEDLFQIRESFYLQYI